MKPASVASRIAAFWLDLLIQLTAVSGAARAVWTLRPAGEFPTGGMAFFRPNDFENFFIWAALTLVFLLAYTLCWDTTPGERLARIRVARPDGAPLTFAQRRSRVTRCLAKCLFLLGTGPVLALLTASHALSLLGLLLPLAALLILSALAWTDPEGAGPQERRGEYRYFAAP